MPQLIGLLVALFHLHMSMTSHFLGEAWFKYPLEVTQVHLTHVRLIWGETEKRRERMSVNKGKLNWPLSPH